MSEQTSSVNFVVDSFQSLGQLFSVLNIYNLYLPPDAWQRLRPKVSLIEVIADLKNLSVWCVAGGYAEYILGNTNTYTDIDIFYAPPVEVPASSDIPFHSYESELFDYRGKVTKIIESGNSFDLVSKDLPSANILEFVARVLIDFDITQCRSALFLLHGTWCSISFRTPTLNRYPLTRRSYLREQKYTKRLCKPQQNTLFQHAMEMILLFILSKQG